MLTGRRGMFKGLGAALIAAPLALAVSQPAAARPSITLGDNAVMRDQHIQGSAIRIEGSNVTIDRCLIDLDQRTAITVGAPARDIMFTNNVIRTSGFGVAFELPHA